MLKLFPEPGETIEGTGSALRAGRTTCVAVLDHCFQQIDRWDDRVNAWVVIDRAGAMKQARALDEELAEGRCRGPLHGIPIGVKDIIDVEGLPTAAGFRPWRERVAATDADIVANLRRVGAIILGKTVSTQFAWIDPPVTRNPWDLGRTPGGSSSGSAVAVATGMCLGAIGTQTGGSIIRPASFCGVAGYKPAHSEEGHAGILPFAPSLDHPGPIARTVRDLALLHYELPENVFMGRDGGGLPFTAEVVERTVATWLEPEDRSPKLLRLRGFFDRRAEPEMLERFESALDSLQDAGAEVIDLADDGFDLEGVVREHRLIMAAEAAAMHESRFAEHLSEYCPHIRKLVEEGMATPVTEYVRAELRWRGAGRRFLSMLPPSFDLIVTPATVGPAPDVATTGNPCMNSPWSYLGWPTVSFPIGLSVDGLPLAIQLAFPNDTGTLLDEAAWCESVTRRAYLAGATHA